MNGNKQVLYYPSPDDGLWNQEIEAILPFLSGKGLDIGSSNRSPVKGITRLDVDPLRYPDILASGDKIPLPDESVDYITAIHNFEHYPNQKEVLTEWLRVLKPRGIIAIVHPDVDYTGKQKPLAENPDKNPFNKHYAERNLPQFIAYLTDLGISNMQLIDYGEAGKYWSFYAIIRKS